MIELSFVISLISVGTRIKRLPNIGIRRIIPISKIKDGMFLYLFVTIINEMIANIRLIVRINVKNHEGSKNVIC